MPKVEQQGIPEDLSKAKRVATWKHRLSIAEKKLEKKGGDIKVGEWRDLIDFFEGKQWKKGMGGKAATFHRITANQVKSNVDSIRPQLYFQNPRVRIQVKNPSLAPQDIPEIDPFTGQAALDQQTGQPKVRITQGTPVALIGGQPVDAQQQTELLESVDNYYLDETGAKKILRRVLSDALVLPYGVAKWEWVFEETEKEVANEETGEIETQRVIARQYPRLSRIKPWCFIWDPELDEFDFSRVRWVAEIKYLSAEALEDDSQLDVDLADIGRPGYFVDSEGDYDRPGKRRRSEEYDADMGRYKVYEIHDLEHGRLMVYVDGAKKFARDEESGYKDVEGSVYSVLGFDETIDDSFPLSIPGQIRSLTEAYNWMLSYQVNHAARGNRKYKAMPGAFKDEVEQEKWERGGDMTLVTVQDMNSGPVPVEDAPIPQDVYAVKGELKREISESIGVTSYQRGIREAGVNTAYEANVIQSSSDVKIQEKRDIVREFLRTIVRKLNQILQLYADVPTVTKIVGLQGDRWVQWTSEDIRGEFFVDVDVYSSLPYSELEEKKQGMEMFSLAQADQFFDPLRLRAHVVRLLKWPENILRTAAEMQAMQEQQQQAMAEQQQAQETQRQQSRTLRPSGGEIRRRPDIKAAIIGAARR